MNSEKVSKECSAPFPVERRKDVERKLIAAIRAKNLAAKKGHKVAQAWAERWIESLHEQLCAIERALKQAQAGND